MQVRSERYLSHATHTWRRHVTRVEKSCHTCIWVMSRMWMSNISGVNASGHTFNESSQTCIGEIISQSETHCDILQHTITHCNLLQHTATRCNTMPRTATHNTCIGTGIYSSRTLFHNSVRRSCNRLQQTATDCNRLQQTAIDCNRLQQTATDCNTLTPSYPKEFRLNPLRLETHCNKLQHTATHCNTLQHTATHCNTLQHTATHCNTISFSHTFPNDNASSIALTPVVTVSEPCNAVCCRVL